MKKMRIGEVNPFLRAFIHSGIALLVTLLLTFLAAKLIAGGDLPLQNLSVYSYVIVAVSAVAGCLLTALTSKSKKLILTAITGVTYFLILCITNGLLMRGEFHRLPMTALLVAVAVVGSSIASSGKGKNRLYRAR